MEFNYDGGGWPRAATTNLYIDGNRWRRPRRRQVPMMFSGDETLTSASTMARSVSDDYTPETSRFTGIVNWVQLDAGDDNHDHLISPEDRLKVAMARQ